MSLQMRRLLGEPRIVSNRDMALGFVDQPRGAANGAGSLNAVTSRGIAGCVSLGRRLDCWPIGVAALGLDLCLSSLFL